MTQMGKKKYWLKKIFFFLLDSMFLAITWATPAGSTSIRQSFCVCCVRFVESCSFRLLASLNGAAYKWCLSAQRWVKQSLFPASLKQPKAKNITGLWFNFFHGRDIFIWVNQMQAVFPPDHCASPQKLFLFSVTSKFIYFFLIISINWEMERRSRCLWVFITSSRLFALIVSNLAKRMRWWVWDWRQASRNQ